MFVIDEQLIHFSTFFRCAIPGLLNDTYEVQSNEHELLIERFIPKDSSGTWSSCKINFSRQNSSENVTSTRSCDRWVYAKTPFRDTVVTEVLYNIY